MISDTLCVSIYSKSQTGILISMTFDSFHTFFNILFDTTQDFVQNLSSFVSIFFYISPHTNIKVDPSGSVLLGNPTLQTQVEPVVYLWG